MATATVIDEIKTEDLGDGTFKAIIEVGGKAQTFIYTDDKDLNRQLLKAQRNASQLIAEQATKLKELAPIAEREKWRDHCLAEGKKFTAQNPDILLYAIEDQQKIEKMIYDQLEKSFPEVFRKAQKENFTADNLGKAYMELGESKSLPARPEAPPATETNKEHAGELPAKTDTGANPPASPARSFSTGIRNGTGSHATPSAVKESPAELRARIDAMSIQEYDRKIATDPEFKKAVDALPPLK